MTIILAILLLIALTYLFFFQHALRYIEKQLRFIGNSETNKELRTESKNPTLIRIVQAINKILANNKENRQKLIRENQQIDQAINNISHDLRTPLSVAVGYTQYLEAEKPDEKEQAKLLKSINSNLAVVEERLEQLLDYNRLNEDRIKTEAEYFDLSAVLKETLLNMYDSFSRRQFAIQLDIEEKVFVIQDKEQTARIIQNILGNILAHGEKFAEISLKKDAENKQAVLTFKNGLGKPIRYPERLTERFYTEDFSRQKENSGLGLYIVKRLVELMAGSLEIKAEKDIFSITLRMRRARGNFD